MTALIRKGLELGPHVELDITAMIVARVLIQANSGGGKSYAIRKICELVYSAQVQVIVLDVEGEFHTLREKFDFSLVSTEGGDAPVSVAHAKDLAHTLLEGHVSAVIDLYDLGTQRAAFIAAFLEGIMLAPRALWHDVLIVVDEANKYAPEDKSDAVGDVAKSKAAIADLMTRGRKRGFSGLLATQRISALDKNCAAECNSALIGRCSLDTDIARAAKSLGMKVKDATELLPEMKPGEFCMYGAAFVYAGPGARPARVMRMQIGEVITTHPERGQHVPVAPSRQVVKQQMAAFAKRASTDAPATFAKGEALDWKDRVTTLEQSVAIRQDENRQLREELGVAIEQRDSALRTNARIHDALQKLIADFTKSAPEIETAITTIDPKTNGKARTKTIVTEGSAHPPAKQRILDTIAMMNRLRIPVNERTLPIWVQYHPRTKSYTNMLSSLRTSGRLDGFELTAQGRAEARVIAPPKDRHALEVMLLAPLQPLHTRVMQHVLRVHSAEPSELAQAMGYDNPRTKSFTNAVSHLRARGMLTAKWPVQPTDVFTLGGS